LNDAAEAARSLATLRAWSRSASDQFRRFRRGVGAPDHPGDRFRLRLGIMPSLGTPSTLLPVWRRTLPWKQRGGFRHGAPAADRDRGWFTEGGFEDDQPKHVRSLGARLHSTGRTRAWLQRCGRAKSASPP